MRNKKWISAAAAVVLAVTALPFTVTAGKNEEKELTKVTLNEVAHSIFYAPQYVTIEAVSYTHLLNGIWWALTLSSVAKGIIFYITFQYICRHSLLKAAGSKN